MDIPELTTDQYPTRYAAHDNPKHLVLYAGELDIYRGGREIAVYADFMENSRYPHLRDGVYVELYGLAPARERGLFVRSHAARPDGSRHQFGRSLHLTRAFVEQAGPTLTTVELSALRFQGLDVMRQMIAECYAWLEQPLDRVLEKSAAWHRERAAEMEALGEFRGNLAQMRRNADRLEESARLYREQGIERLS